jgi:hypothetical protein
MLGDEPGRKVQPIDNKSSETVLKIFPADADFVVWLRGSRALRGHMR